MNRLVIGILVVLLVLAAGCIDSLQKTGTGDSGRREPVIEASGDKEAGDNSSRITLPALQLTGSASFVLSHNASDEQLLLPLPDSRQAHEAITGMQKDMGSTVAARGTEGATNVTGSSSGSIESSSQASSEAGPGFVAPMPASGLDTFSEPGQSSPSLPASGSTSSPPGSYYEGSGTDDTGFRNYMVPDCGCT